MHFNLKFMREFFKFFHTTDTSVSESTDPNFNSLHVGNINAITPETGLVVLPLHITQDKRQTLDTAWIVRLVDGKTMVVFHLDCFMESINTPDMNALYATVAHELGHYFSGHFDREPNKNLDIKAEDQDFLIKQYNANPCIENEIRYMRCLFFCLIRGGVNIAELEADMLALRFVPLSELVHIHTQDFKNEANPFTILEKVSRIKRLNAYAETAQYAKMREPSSERYSLYIELFDMNKPAEEREKREEPEVLLTE